MNTRYVAFDREKQEYFCGSGLKPNWHGLIRHAVTFESAKQAENRMAEEFIWSGEKEFVNRKIEIVKIHYFA